MVLTKPINAYPILLRVVLKPPSPATDPRRGRRCERPCESRDTSARVIVQCLQFCYNRAMSITREDVQHIAELAKLRLTEAEEARYQEQLSAILDYAARLNALDTSAISPTATVLPLRSVMRDDVARPSPSADEILANAPARVDQAFEVRAVLD